MIWMLVFALAGSTAGVEYTPELNDYLLGELSKLAPLNVLDDPSITNVTTTPSKNRLPDVAQIRYYNYYQAVSYCYDLEDLSCEYCLKIKPDIANHTVLYNETHNTLAMVAKSHTRREIVVVFRGSINSWNFVLDFAGLLNVRPNDGSNIKVHTGFYIATLSLYERVVLAITAYRKDHPSYKIVLVGLSLGATMARMTYFFLKDRNQFPNAVYELYTYGELRVGNRPFAEFMNSQDIVSARVVNRGDIASHLPPVNILGTNILFDHYVQPNHEFWIRGNDADEQTFCSGSVLEDPTCSTSLRPFYSAVDHLTYFDVNVASAFAQPLQLASIPFGVLPIEMVVPPLPKFIETPLGNTLDAVVGGVLPYLG